MPKLDALQTAERLQRLLDKLLLDEQVASRDLRALLTQQQGEAIDTAWYEQQLLRAQKRTADWKTKRQIQIEVVKTVLAEYEENELSVLETKLAEKELQQAKIFLREFFSAKQQGKNHSSAWRWANNELVRAGMKRIDEQTTQHMNTRDKEVRQMEELILARIRSDTTDK